MKPKPAYEDVESFKCRYHGRYITLTRNHKPLTSWLGRSLMWNDSTVNVISQGVAWTIYHNHDVRNIRVKRVA